MYDAEDMESQPLAGYTDGSEDGLTTSEKDKFAAHEKVSFADRKCHLLLIIFIILVTNAFSGAVGAWWKSRLTNLDSECALHTTQYCRPLGPERSIMVTDSSQPRFSKM